MAQLERRIRARFGERGLTKAARDLGKLVVMVSDEAGQSRDRLRRMTIGARIASVTIVGATVIALAFSLRSAVLEGLAKTTDWVPLVESVINDLVFAAIAVVFLWAFPERLALRSLLRLLYRLRSLAHVIAGRSRARHDFHDRDADDRAVEQDLAEDLAPPPLSVVQPRKTGRAAASSLSTAVSSSVALRRRRQGDQHVLGVDDQMTDQVAHEPA